MNHHRRKHWSVTGNSVSGARQIQLAKPSSAGYYFLPPTPQNSGFKTRREALERKRWLDANHPARFL